MCVKSCAIVLQFATQKMRLTSRWFAGRRPQNENKVPFNAVLPLQLKDRVSSKFRKTSDRGCLYEMTLLLTCLDENAYEDKLCLSKLKSLEACYERYNENIKRAKIETNVPVPNSKNLNSKQVTYLLRQYPTV
ncbi:uncharacterized protein LOC109863660 isoform X2 [Pseudomyrmex gracilis]|uniref:uncharacterized protein LOC109863660 isoform X2 n=1 Tax=Pseudomyrmex gracilis TaxID=219809 RepID=UPI0009956A52|nr:uncharacterized protein LOC109863660 isoform X2 [Pseudomyrmex gracilis]